MFLPATTVKPPNTVPLGESKMERYWVGGGGGTVFGGPVLGGFTVFRKGVIYRFVQDVICPDQVEVE